MSHTPLLTATTTTPLPCAAGVNLPAIIDQAESGQAESGARRRFTEFFTAHIRTKNTRGAYARASGQFLAWCEPHGRPLEALEPVHVVAYMGSR